MEFWVHNTPTLRAHRDTQTNREISWTFTTTGYKKPLIRTSLFEYAAAAAAAVQNAHSHAVYCSSILFKPSFTGPRLAKHARKSRRSFNSGALGFFFFGVLHIFIGPMATAYSMRRIIQESLANAKVNARQHCVVRSHWNAGNAIWRTTMFHVVASQTREITRNSERFRPYSSSRSSKVIDLGVTRKPIYTVSQKKETLYSCPYLY